MRGRRKGVSSEETYSQIVDAGRIHFASRGFASTKLRDVASRAGVSPASLYHYFGSKSDLYVAVFRETESRMSDCIRAATSARATVWERLGAAARAAASLYEEEPATLNFMATVPVEMRSHPELIPGIVSSPRTIDAILTQIIDDGCDSGELPIDLDRTAAGLLLGGGTLGVAMLARLVDPSLYSRMLHAFDSMMNPGSRG